MKIESSKYIFEKASNIKFTNISAIGTELFHTNRHIGEQTGRQASGQREVSKLIIDFRNFVKASYKNYNDAIVCPSIWT